MSNQLDEIRLTDFVPKAVSRAARDLVAPGMSEVLDNLDEIEALARQANELGRYPTRLPDRMSMMTLARRILDAVEKLRDEDSTFRSRRFYAHWIKMHLKDLQEFVNKFMQDTKAMKLMKRKADRDMVQRAMKIAKGEKPFPSTFGPRAVRHSDMEDSTTDPNRPRSESMTFKDYLQQLDESKYMCRNGHLHNSQDRATNCATCKRQERKRTEKAATAASK